MDLHLNSRNIPSDDKKDIVELQEKIQQFKAGKIDEERFKLYRLTRGVYGQRQLGVQMFRIKVPYGSITPEQIRVVADISDRYASGNLHLTTRQDIQLHYVKLVDSPAIWAELTENGMTGREACGNTVRNLTASPTAGIDPHEPFDVTPYAHAVAFNFLRNPICQEMGRKIKPAFSSSEKDTAFTYFHDFGFIPKVKTQNGAKVRGFKVFVGGGLGAQALVAHEAFSFLPADEIIPFMESALRVFDRYGEREKRHKARLKFLIKSIGIEAFLELVEEEKKSLSYQKREIDTNVLDSIGPVPYFEPNVTIPENEENYQRWLRTNTFEQKQKGFFGVYIKVFLGDIKSDKARLLADAIDPYVSKDVRITINQGLLLRHVHQGHLVALYEALNAIGFADPDFGSIVDITACPGTDTCNLAVTNSTGLSGALENHIKEYHADIIEESDIRIKISGCMNACGQHTAASIGFHGSSIKRDGKVIPAMQILQGGGVDPTGKASIAEKVIKIPTKRIPEGITILLNHYEINRSEGEYYNDYYRRFGKRYFYDLLRHLAEVETLEGTDYFDWGQDHLYKQAIGVGECAGVIMDVVGTIIKESQIKLDNAREKYKDEQYAESVYYAYTSFIIGAKALLLSEDIKCNTQIGILKDFQTLLVETGIFPFQGDFKDHVLQINKYQPNASFSQRYLEQAVEFLHQVVDTRTKRQGEDDSDKEVIESYYKA